MPSTRKACTWNSSGGASGKQNTWCAAVHRMWSSCRLSTRLNRMTFTCQRSMALLQLATVLATPGGGQISTISFSRQRFPFLPISGTSPQVRRRAKQSRDRCPSAMFHQRNHQSPTWALAFRPRTWSMKKAFANRESGPSLNETRGWSNRQKSFMAAHARHAVLTSHGAMVRSASISPKFIT